MNRFLPSIVVLALSSAFLSLADPVVASEAVCTIEPQTVSAYGHGVTTPRITYPCP
jgi:hypothetical protein